MMTPSSLTRFCALGGAALLAGCFGGETDNLGTGAQLSVDYFADTDVVGFHYVVENTSCSGEAIMPMTWEFNVNLLDGIFPGQVGLIESVLDEDSRHLGADLFVTLKPGCYNVTAIPASSVDVNNSASWTPSADCSVASGGPYTVVDGQTTETAPLISQCVGDPRGALDTVVLLNHPPVVEVTIDEKYNYECETVEACVTVFDWDDDPISVDFAKTSGSGLFALNQSAPTVVGFDDGHRIWEVCADIVTRWTGSYDITVTVWDHMADGSKFEDTTGEASNDDMTFPIHTNWIEDPLCFDMNMNLVPAPGSSIERYPGCGWTTAEQYYCSGNHNIDPAVVAFLCDGTDLIEGNLYPMCGAGGD